MVSTTACKWDSVIPFEPMWAELKRIIKPRGAIVLFGSQPFTSALIMSNPKMFKYEWVWMKNRTTNYLNAKKQPLRTYENIEVFCEGQTTFNAIPFEDKSYGHRSNKIVSGTQHYSLHSVQTNTIEKAVTSAKNVIYFNSVHPDSFEYIAHPTQKPVALMEYLIKTYTNEGEKILDFTMGSGTTGVACINTNRQFIGIERDAKYFEVAERRIADAMAAPKQLELLTA